MKFLGIHVIFTCVPATEFEKVYPQSELPGVHCVNVLTGYVPNNLIKLKVPPYESRPIDVSYRGRAVPFWLGALGQEKTNIAKQFTEDAKRFGLKVDIDYREESRIYKKKWIEFLMSSKACLGVESGASVFDFTGDIESKVNQHLKAEPGASFNLLQNLYFKNLEGKIKLNQISPRCFEAASLRTLMILYEGEYSNILLPWRHYIPLKKDHSNMDEVVNALRNTELAKRITSQAYEEIALNSLYSSSYLTTVFDGMVEDQIIIRKEILRPRISCFSLKLMMLRAKLSLLSKSFIMPSRNFSTDRIILGVRKICPVPVKKLLKKVMGFK